MSIPLVIILLLIPIIIWEFIWKGIGMWKSARNNQLGWFVAILILNTLGILPIVYIYFFQKKIDGVKAEQKKLEKTADNKQIAKKTTKRKK